MEWIANQPVQFGVEAPCGTCDETVAQLSDNTDTIQFQFRISSCGGINLLESFVDYPYNTWVLGGGWAITGGVLCHTGTGGLRASAQMPAATFPAGYYKFVVIVSSMSGTGSLDVKYGTAAGGYTLIGNITGVGTWTFYSYVVAAGVPPNLFILIPTSSEDFSVCVLPPEIHNVLQKGVIAVYNANTNVYAGTGISYASNPTLWIFKEDTVTVTLKWSTLSVPLSNGCYYLCLWDPCLNSNGQNYPAVITNSGFTGSATGWTLEGTAVYSANTVILGSADYGFVQQTVFNAYVNQCVTIVVTAVTGSLKINFGTALIQTITAPGTYTICGTPVGSLIVQAAVAIGNSATIDSISPRTLSTSEYVCNLQSNTFKLADYTGDCTKLISASNTENGLGFVFGTSLFVPKIRLDSKLKGMKYPSERNSYENSAGTKIVTYYSGRKAKTFCVDLQPEYVHDFLRLLFGFDNFYIDGVLYFVEDDEYNVEIPAVSDNVGSVKFLVSTRTQDIKNTNC